jgi:hypothetical protein
MNHPAVPGNSITCSVAEFLFLKFECKNLLTDADAKALGYSKVEEVRHSDFWHDFTLLEKSEVVVARIQLIKSGKSGYAGGVQAMKMLKSAVKLSEESKYGDKNYVSVPTSGGVEVGKKKMMITISDVEVGVLKGEYYLVVMTYERPDLKGNAKEKLARRLAELCSKRLP